MGIGKRVKERRIELNLTQEELSKLLGITKSAVGNYENEISHPKEDVLYKLFDALKCDANYLFQDEFTSTVQNNVAKGNSGDDLEHLKKYHALDSHGKAVVASVLNLECSRTLKTSPKEECKRCAAKEEEPETTELQYYDDKAAAGDGYTFNDNGFEMITVIKSCDTESADFVVSVCGGSMEPMFYNGDKVLVRSQPDVYEGEIGLFAVNDKGYIKKKGIKGLISVNDEYKDIYPTEDDNFKCFGKVIRKLRKSDIPEQE